MVLPIVQPGMSLFGAAAALAATGLSASPIAQSIEMISLITRIRICRKAFLSMNACF